jgi:hypothetical protein
MIATIFAEFFGVIDELIGLDHRRIVLVFVVAVEPRQNDPDRFLVGGLKLLSSQSRQVDIVGEYGRTAHDHSGCQ